MVFIYAGWMKFSDMDATVAGFGQIGLAPFLAYLVAAVELLSGVAMLLGSYVRHAGLALAIIMFFALVLVKAEMGWVAAQIDVVLLASALSVALMGPGKFAASRD